MKVGLLFIAFVVSMLFAVANNIADTIPPARAHHELIYDQATGRIVLTSGSTTTDSGRSYTFFNDMWTFNGNTWKQLPAAGNTRSGVRLAFHTKDNRLFSFGGYDGDSSLGDLRMLVNGDWKTVSDEDSMRAAEPGFVYDEKRNRLITFGGSARRGTANGITYEWNGRNWQRFNGENPPARMAFAMVYDERRHVTVVYGGMDQNGKPLNDGVWEFNGKKWTNIQSNEAGTFISGGCTYDSKRGVVVLFGTQRDEKLTSETWAWNGKRWQKMSAEGPPARYMGYIAYDAKRDRIVLFGGRVKWPTDANDTWEWDGSRWYRVGE
jgi:hypothetical protein